MQVTDFAQYMRPGKKGHLIGIGGVSMAPLAMVLAGRGLEIRGSDMNDSPTLDTLRESGIKVFVGHRAENAEGADFVVRTAAAHDDNPEVERARQLGIPVFERSQAWGAISENYGSSVCVAGTHGKTTTTAMVTHIFMKADRDPTVMIGGTLALLGSGYRVGEGDTIILESCEYYNSFHNFFATTAVILNVDNDHLDFFGTVDNIRASFRTFTGKVPDNGWVVANADDEGCRAALKGLDRRIVTFGLAGEADMRAENLVEGKNPSFDAVFKGKQYAHIELNVSGRHNVYNALAACTAAYLNGIDGKTAEEGLAEFKGTGRRAEFKGSFNGADVYDDYAHHPRELQALLDAVDTMGYKRVLCIFQPHTYSRTKTHFDAFVSQLKRPDRVYLAEIYAAREKNTDGTSAKMLADEVPGAFFSADFNELAERVRREAKPGDIVLTVGAGDIYKVGDILLGRG
ncbi:MAG: UDP-N-acetylmuramate--L-alanine ligase [Oscillospiraceae bacterium]|nr:UDP-N-acetylmuramate--L-alanine ligase [Oscillospiraceae bacterium]